MGVGYHILRFKFEIDFSYFLSAPLNTETLDARGVAANPII